MNYSNKFFDFLETVTKYSKTQKVSINSYISLLNSDKILPDISQENSLNFLENNKISYCPNELIVFPYLSVYENLQYFAKIYGISNIFIDKILNIISLAKYKNCYPDEISLKNIRKLMLGICLLKNPDILLINEPSLMKSENLKIWGIIRKMFKNVIFISHDYKEIMENSDKFGEISLNGNFEYIGNFNNKN